MVDTFCCILCKHTNPIPVEALSKGGSGIMCEIGIVCKSAVKVAAYAKSAISG